MKFQKMYVILMDGAEKAIRAMEEQNFGLARQLLIEAEQKAEEVFLSEAEPQEGES